VTQLPIDPRQHVLLIEDDDADALLVERALERFGGLELRHVTRLRSALDTLAEKPCDVALLDLSLPDSFGLEGVTTLHASFPDLPVVVLTGLTDNELALQALERGAQDYLAKGQCSPEMLVRTLRYAIQRQQIQRENQRLLSELGRQARHDGLTGLTNRRSLVAELEREWMRSQGGGKPLACVLLDVDFFKRVNDLHGHAAGDTVLQALAEQLRTSCRNGDTPGRYGGEEFLAILPHTTEDEAAAWAEQLRQCIAATPIPLGNETIYVTVSFGVAARGSDIASGEQLVARADQSLRLAKQLGRDQVVSFAQIAMVTDPAGRAMDEAFAQLTAEDIMTPIVATLEETTTLHEATQLLLGLQLDSAPVVDAEGNLSGILGEENLGHALTSHSAWQRTVADVMKKKPPAFSAQASASALHEFLTRTASRRVLIVADQRPIGTVSRAGLLRWREYHDLATRSRWANVPQPAAAPAGRGNLLALLAEVSRQSATLHDRLQAAGDAPLDLLVTGATRIQLLLEDAVVQAQQLNDPHRELSTFNDMVG